MLTHYKTADGKITVIPEFEPGSWLNITQPTAGELRETAAKYEIEESFLMAALDEEESARIEAENGQVLIVMDIPLQEKGPGINPTYSTMPLVIIIAKQSIVTVTKAETNFLEDFINNRIKGFYTQFKTRFVLQILYRNAQKFMQYLRLIERSSTRLEEGLTKSLTNRELMEMLRLQKSLVYLSTSLRTNGTVLERLVRNPSIKSYQEDEDLLDDVIIENKQAIEMAEIYSRILTATAESYASIISNNQNNIVKVLTSATIVMTIPTIISGLMGMNVELPIPFENSFWPIVGATAVLALVVFIILRRRRFF